MILTEVGVLMLAGLGHITLFNFRPYLNLRHNCAVDFILNLLSHDTMNLKFILLFFLLYSTTIFAQKEKKISIEINYGLNGNFFVGSYDEVGGPPAKRFLNKNFVGTIGGLEIKYTLNKRSRLGFAFAKSRNTKEINYTGNIIPVAIINFQITHINKLFQLFYDRNLSNKILGLTYQSGLFYLRMNQQEVEIADRINGGVLIEERNYKSNNLEEAGIFLGFHYSKYIDTKFELGIKSRTYYLISTNSFEAITLTPSLTYHF